MQGLFYRGRMGVLAAAVVLSACAAVPPQGQGSLTRPPVVLAVDSPESPVDGQMVPAEPPVTKQAEAPTDTQPKPDTYTVRAGDTLIRIGLDSGQSPLDIARWNGLSDPGKIVIGQVLRLVAPPPGETPPAIKPSTPPTPPSPTVSDEDLIWMWPCQGPVLAGFSQSKKKGIEIGGSAGDAVLAAADGKVVYAGAGLRGYGNLVILKHNSTYVSVYAHNQAVLVKEDDTVKRGQKIAEVGSSEADRTKLHFEVRKLGNPVDPAKYMPTK